MEGNQAEPRGSAFFCETGKTAPGAVPLIPRHKLERLPRPQRLRKLERLFAAAEYGLSRGREPSPPELAALEGALDLLRGDEAFPAAARALLRSLGTLPADRAAFYRALNGVRHILLAETGRSPADWDFIDPAGGLEAGKRRVFPGMLLYLEDIRSPFNVGAIFRAAESFGVEMLLLSPLCADPCHPRARRSAMGCTTAVPWKRLPLPEGPCFALETGGVSLGAFPWPRSALMIAGSEELGVSPGALARADASLGRVSIPTWGAKGSLNVTVAIGIALQAWADGVIRCLAPN